MLLNCLPGVGRWSAAEPERDRELHKVRRGPQHQSPTGQEGGELGRLAGHAPRAGEGGGDEEEGQGVEDHLGRRIPRKRESSVY